MSENSSDSLKELQILCNSLIDKNKELDRLLDKVKDLKESIKHLSEESIPATMEELGMEKIQLKTGETISTKLDVSASINEENRLLALDWLTDHGFGDLIKTKTVVYFQRQERNEALEMAENLSNQGYDVALDENVHPMTLKAWLKEQLAIGNDVPLDLFGARQYYKTVVQKPKK